MLGLLAEKGYTGYLSYEAPNPEQWARSPYDVAREGVELTRKLLRDAVPSYAALIRTVERFSDKIMRNEIEVAPWQKNFRSFSV